MLPARAAASWTAGVAAEDGCQEPVAVVAAVDAAAGLQDVAVRPEVD